MDKMAFLISRVKAHRESVAPKAGLQKAASADTSSASTRLIREAQLAATRLRSVGTTQLDLLSGGVMKVAGEEISFDTYGASISQPSTEASGAGTPSTPKDTAQAPSPMQPSTNEKGNPVVYATPTGDGGTPPKVTDTRLPTPTGEPVSPEILSPGDTATDTSHPEHPAVEGQDPMPKAASVLRKMSGGRELLGPDAQVRAGFARVHDRFGIHSPEAALAVFQKTAQRLGVSVSVISEDLLKLSDGSYIRNLWKAAELNGLDAEGDEISEARRVVDAAIKARQELPTSSEVSDVANTSPLAADIAIAEAAELIAATGGTVSAPGANAMAMEVPPAMGGNVPAPGAPMPPAAPPMDPAMAAPPMDPAMAQGGAPPMDPSMAAPPMDPAMAGPPGAAPPVPPEQKVASALQRAVLLMKQAGEGGDPQLPLKEDPAGQRPGGPDTVDPIKSLDAGTEKAPTGSLISGKEQGKMDAVAGSQAGLRASDSGTAEATEISDTETTTSHSLEPRTSPTKEEADVANEGYVVDIEAPEKAVPGSDSDDKNKEREEDAAATKVASDLYSTLFG